MLLSTTGLKDAWRSLAQSVVALVLPGAARRCMMWLHGAAVASALVAQSAGFTGGSNASERGRRLIVWGSRDRRLN